MSGSGGEAIWEYYQRTLDLYELLDGLLRTPEIASSVVSPYWKGLSSKDVSRQLDDMTRELELQVSLSMVASFESVLREDFDGRRAGHPLARWKEWRGFDSAVKLWARSHTAASDVVDLFLKVIRFRHSLAHGRRGLEAAAVEFDPEAIKNAATKLQETIPGFPRLVW